MAGQLGREADAGDVEEVPVVDPAEVDLAPVALRDHGRRLGELGRNAESAGEIVAGARGQDAERQAGLGQSVGRRVHGAITTGENHQVDGVSLTPDRGADFIGCLDPAFVHTDAPRAQHVDRRGEIALATPAAVVDDEQRARRRHHWRLLPLPSKACSFPRGEQRLAPGFVPPRRRSPWSRQLAGQPIVDRADHADLLVDLALLGEAGGRIARQDLKESLRGAPDRADLAARNRRRTARPPAGRSGSPRPASAA